MRWATRVAVRLAVIKRIEPRLRGVVSFLMELDEDSPIPYDCPMANLTKNARGHLIIMLREEFNMTQKGLPSRAAKEWYTYSDVLLFLAKRFERFTR